MQKFKNFRISRKWVYRILFVQTSLENVLFLSLKGVEGLSYDEVYLMFAAEIVNPCIKFSFLKNE